MIIFDVLLNGQPRCRAGVERGGVLTAVLSWLSPEDSRGHPRREELWVRVGGINHPDEQVEWLQDALQVGDEVTIKIVQADKADEPRKRKRPPLPDPTRPAALKTAKGSA